ncbi:MAG: MFS transporter [bacterium]|nr:MFS transporter [bacterium]
MTSMTQSRTPRAVNPWLVLALICVPVFIGSLDLTIVSAFLPEIIVRLELPIQSVVDDAAWVVSGYLLAYTVSLTFMGRVSDLVGRRITYIACLVVFMIGSFIVAEVDPQARTGVAGILYDLIYRVQGTRPDPSSVALTTIIIGRVIQALGAGAIVPVTLALVGDLFPANKRAQPLGLVGAIDTLGWVLGHLYGGIMVRWFTDNAAGFESFFRSVGLNWDAPDWRTLFWINLPISLAGLVITLFVLRGTKQERGTGTFDFLGTALIVGALSCLVLGLGANIEVSATASNFDDLGGLPPYAGPLLIAAGVMFAAFIVWELRVRYPVFDLRLFARRNISMGALTNFFVGFALMIGLVSVPILVNIRLNDASELSQAAFQVGILLSALTVPMAIAAFPGGWLSERIGYHRTAFIGLFIAGIGFLLIWRTWTPQIDDGLIALEMALVGVGLGLTFSPISAAVINAADSDKLGAASALVIIMRLLGMTVGIALLTAFASQRLAGLAAAELGAAAADPFAAIDVYVRLTIQVLSEMGLAGAILCAVGLVPALLLRGKGREGAAVPVQPLEPTTVGQGD